MLSDRDLLPGEVHYITCLISFVFSFSSLMYVYVINVEILFTVRRLW